MIISVIADEPFDFVAKQGGILDQRKDVHVIPGIDQRRLTHQHDPGVHQAADHAPAGIERAFANDDPEVIQDFAELEDAERVIDLENRGLIGEVHEGASYGHPFAVATDNETVFLAGDQIYDFICHRAKGLGCKNANIWTRSRPKFSSQAIQLGCAKANWSAPVLSAPYTNLWTASESRWDSKRKSCV